MNEHGIVVLPKPKPTKADKRREEFFNSVKKATAVCARAGDAWAVWNVLLNLTNIAAEYAKEATK